MIQLKIMTPDHGVCYDQEVKYLDIKTLTGHIGVQQNITPMIAAVGNGMFKIQKPDGSWISGIMCKGTLYVDKEIGIKVFTSAFKWMNEVNISEIEENIKVLKDKIEKNTKDHREYNTWKDQLLINENLLDAYKHQ